ncbi:DUF397 domain-containing protein [Allonocardiopsis opalescens]|uniref:Uncharacterized protein DUF397 n=1 Tax=Allonocardiopsis opalescens TaxID=1144618 RepID=A0A2T0Q2T3_9ACTN|nr:DUF397 domain-containing protein [Allonocardiopsis opalescens]PRX98096.1 uncharacterized protein DUF397 [Allonocardiopsis opalescens]
MSELIWRKSSYSSANGGDCVEVAELAEGRAVRDSKHPDQPHLMISGSDWNAFIHAVRNDAL